jgi:hypothetical protein
MSLKKIVIRCCKV